MTIKKAALINASAKYSTIIINIIVISILSRILTPEIFGIVAIINVFTTLFVLLSDFGLGTGIIQRQDLSKRDINVIFGFSIYVGIFLSIIFIVLSFFIVNFYDNTVYYTICLLLSISVFFNTVNTTPNALLMKEQKFTVVAKRVFLVNLFSAFISITIAFTFRNFYALIFQSIATSVAAFIWNISSVKIKPIMKIDLSTIDKIKGYSGFHFAYNIINYFSRNLDNFLIGKYIGQVELGYYNQAYTLMMYPLNNLTNVITPILHPILTKYQDNKQYIYDKYVQIVKILFYLSIIIASVSFYSTKDIILFVFGDQWESSIIPFKYLAVSLIFQMTVSSAGSIYLSLGKTRLMFISGLVYTSIIIILLLIGISYKNIQIVSLLISLGLIMKFFIDYYFLVKHGFQKSYLSFLKIFVKGFIILLLIILLFIIVKPISGYSHFINLVANSVIVCCVFIFGTIITGEYKFILNLIHIKKEEKI
ncbi:MAG: lipopolysaccharide biosynthesis protein [Acholeplasma sp.]|nr:lipopolysaccharide biosynthesis protein [Acholeplasma sp.]